MAEAGLVVGRLPGAAAGVVVEFIDVDGAPRREPLSGCWNVAFERVAAVRGFASFRGQRHRPGPHDGIPHANWHPAWLN